MIDFHTSHTLNYYKCMLICVGPSQYGEIRMCSQLRYHSLLSYSIHSCMP